jgi:WD40 repeat protein
VTSDVAIDAIVTPYKGLANYIEADAAFFFGREREREVIIANLKARKLTLLYGASGVGKSSLLRAGVAAHLTELAHDDVEDIGTPEFIPVVFSSWSNDPLTGLAEAIRGSVAQCTGTPLPPTASRRLSHVIEAATKASSSYLLIVLDQFEEYFLYHSEEQGEVTFAGEFASALNRDRLQANFMVSIREDALAKLDVFKRDVPKLFDTYLRVSHLDRAAAREAIERPVERHNSLVASQRRMTVSRGLADAVLGQVRSGQVVLEQVGHGTVHAERGAAQDDEIETPYLQLVMTRLWEAERAAGSHQLRVETLDRLGGAQEIVRTHLDSSLAGLSEGEREIAVDLFHHLVTPSGTKIAHSASDLAAYVDDDEQTVAALLDRLTRPDTRIVRPVPPPPGGTGPTRYEIFHDVLAPAILDWRTRQVSARAVERQRLAARAASRRRRVRAAALVGALLLAGVVAGTIVELTRRSAAHRQRLEEARDLARAAVNQSDRAYDTSVALALASWNKAHTREGQLALRQALTTKLGRFPLVGARRVDIATYSPDGALILTNSTRSGTRLWSARTRRTLVRLLPADMPVVDARFSGDGRRVVALRERGAVVWDVAEARQGHVRRVAALPQVRGVLLAVSRRGSFIASYNQGFGRATVRLWDVKTRRQRGTFATLGAVSSGAFTADEHRLSTAGYGKEAVVWDVAQRKVVSALHPRVPVFPTLPPFSGRPSTVSPDGKRAFLAGRAASGLLDLRTGHFIRRFEGSEVQGVFSADGRRVATIRGRAVTLRDARTGRALLPSHRVESFLRRVRFAPADDDLLVLEPGSGRLRFWDTKLPNAVPIGPTVDPYRDRFEPSPTGDAVLTVTATGAAVWPTRPARTTRLGATKFADAAVHPRLPMAAGAGKDGRVRVWSTFTGHPMAVRRVARAPLAAVRFSPDGTRLLATATDGTARLWLVPAMRHALRLATPRGELSAACFSPDGRLVALGDRAGRISVWTTATGKRRWRAQSPHGAVLSLAFSGDGRRLLAADSDRTASVWDARGGKAIRVFRPGRRRAVPKRHFVPHPEAQFSPDGKRVLMVGPDGVMRVWNDDGKLVERRGRNDSLINSAVFSHDGRRVAAGSDDGTAYLYGDDGTPIDSLRHGVDEVTTMAFNADDTALVTVGHSTAYLWDLATAQKFGELPPVDSGLGHTNPSVTLSSDSRRLVWLDISGRVQLGWCPGCASTKELPKLLRPKLARPLTPAQRRDALR